MRYLLLSLLLLNLLYALWQLQGQPAPVIPLADSMRSDTSVGSSSASSRDSFAEPRGSAALCVTLGRFAAVTDAGLLRQRLLVLDIDSRVLERDTVVGAEYWLVLPVVGGERHAVIQLSALQEQGIDSFLITRGELAGNLSLGVFVQEDNARARQEQLSGLGQDVRLHALSKRAPEFVVEVASQARRLVDQALLSRLRQDFPGLQHRYEACSGVANSAHMP